MPEEKRAKIRTWSVLRIFFRASLRYPVLLWLGVAAVFGMQAAAVVGPLYLKKFVDVLATSSVSEAAVITLFGILASYAIIQVLNWLCLRIEMVTNMRIEARVMEDLSNQAFAYLVRHSHDFFASNFAGTLTRRVTRYARAYEQVVDSALRDFLPTILFAAGSIAVLYSRNMWLGLTLLAWVILFVIIQVLLTRWQHPLRTARVAADSRMTGALSDAISNQSTITLFAAERYEENFLGKIVRGWREATLRAWMSNAWIQGIQHALAIVVEIGLLVGAVLLWKQGHLTVGDFVLIQVYILGLINHVWNLGNVLRRIHDAFAEASEMIEIMETPHGIEDAAAAQTLTLQKGEMEFKSVGFYFNPDRPVLSDFSLHIRGGEKVALVGPSGAGKTTVTKLILRLYDPGAGSVTIDGQDLRAVTQESLRSNISFVPQEPLLFHRSLFDNILYGRISATKEEVIAAAKRAHCHEFISELPLGYDTHVGERGVKLSGGERQRVAIARAILKDAPILILDEATSSLDSHSEALIQEAFAELMKGKTVIAIAHRLSTIMKMDRIIVMEQGKVILTGSHQELVSQESNLYKRLWEIQAGGFLGGAEDDEE
jgi:ATP-binding cassette, subfamily B, bacterial